MSMKRMRSADKCAPKSCTECGAKLSKPKYGYLWPIEFRVSPTYSYDRPAANSPVKDQAWHIECKCGLVYHWTSHEVSNGCWKIRSINPLFDSKKVVVIA